MAAVSAETGWNRRTPGTLALLRCPGLRGGVGGCGRDFGRGRRGPVLLAQAQQLEEANNCVHNDGGHEEQADGEEYRSEAFLRH